MGTSVIHIKTELECKVFLFDEEKGIVTPGKYFNLEVRKGEQDLLFVSTADNSLRYRLLYLIKESDTDYHITINESMYKMITEFPDNEIKDGFYDEKNVLYSCDGIYLIRCDNNDIEKYVIKPTCKVICDYAFSKCKSLSTVTLPEGLTHIGNMAFNDCGALLNISFPNSLQYIGNEAFCGCFSLKEVHLPINLNHIGNQSFCYCRNLTHINIPNNLKHIGDEAFAKTGIKDIECDSYQFLYVNSCLIDKKDMKVIACFSDASDVKLISGITIIGKSAFWGCEITNITIPQGVTHIDDSAFEFCKELSEIILPDSLISIGSDSFSGCYKLSEIKLPASLTSIGNGAFSVKVHISSGLRSRYSALFNDKGVKDGEPLVFEPLSHIYIPRGTKTKFEHLLPNTLYSKLFEIDYV